MFINYLLFLFALTAITSEEVIQSVQREPLEDYKQRPERTPIDQEGKRKSEEEEVIEEAKSEKVFENLFEDRIERGACKAGTNSVHTKNIDNVKLNSEDDVVCENTLQNNANLQQIKTEKENKYGIDDNQLLGEMKYENNKNEEIDSSAIEIMNEELLRRFINGKGIRIVFYYAKGRGVADVLTAFLSLFSRAANYLNKFGIALAKFECMSTSTVAACSSPRANGLVYGYQDSRETIAFPVHTVSTWDSMVASFIHLSLINRVQIINFGHDYKMMESKCLGQCDYVIASLATLGNRAHRLFLTAVHGFTSNPVLKFAITTDAVNNSDAFDPYPEFTPPDVMWLLQCSHDSHGSHCSLSRQLGGITALETIETFFRYTLHTKLVTPLSDPLTASSLPHIGYSKSLFVVVGDSKANSADSAKQIAMRVRAMAVTAIVNRDEVDSVSLSALLDVEDVTVIPAPAIFFFEPDKLSPSSYVVNFVDSLQWIGDQLFSIHHRYDFEDVNGEEFPLDMLQPLDTEGEYVDDDQVSQMMVNEDAITGVTRLKGKGDLRRRRDEDNLLVVAFTFPWDPSSNILLQHLQDLSLTLNITNNSDVKLLSFDCFEFGDSCGDASTIPRLVFFKKNVEILYKGPQHSSEILKNILILQYSWEVNRINEEDINSLLDFNLIKELEGVADIALLAVTTDDKDESTFVNAVDTFRGKIVMAITVVEKSKAHELCNCTSSSKCSTDNCLILVKRNDFFQPRVIIKNSALEEENIRHSVTFYSKPIVSELTSHDIVDLTSSNSTRLVLVFLGEDDIHDTTSKVSSVLRKMARIASGNNARGLFFRWIKRCNAMADRLFEKWSQEDLQTPLQINSDLLIAGVDLKGGSVTFCRSVEEMDKWMQALDGGGKTSQKFIFQERVWSPSLHGLDYMEIMEEETLE